MMPFVAVDHHDGHAHGGLNFRAAGGGEWLRRWDRNRGFPVGLIGLKKNYSGD